MISAEDRETLQKWNRLCIFVGLEGAFLADTSQATLLNSDNLLAPEAKKLAASLFDYLRDVADISDDAPFANKLA